MIMIGDRVRLEQYPEEEGIVIEILDDWFSRLTIIKGNSFKEGEIITWYTKELIIAVERKNHLPMWF